MAESKTKHPPRLILRNFLSLHICKELEFIHKSCCTVGYRPNVFSTTLSHLIATNSAHLIIPFVSIREKLKEKMEEYFGCEYELFIEFTGLISWCRGASIGWHSDDNRAYLKQRDFAAVCYLNNYNLDFKGGLFHFKDGEPSTVEPTAGDVIIYTADSQNIHSVDKVTDGERVTLTLWFTRDASHDEDAKLISSLSHILVDSLNPKIGPFIPVPASTSMYWFPPDEASNFQSGFDIRCARLSLLGFDLYPYQEKNYFSVSDSCFNFLELLNEPLQLTRGDELLEGEFGNVLHILQVVQFYCWKISQLGTNEVKDAPSNVVPLSHPQRKIADVLKLAYLKDLQLAEKYFSNVSLEKNLKQSFDWVSFSAVVADWEAYTWKLQKELLTSLPYWRTHLSIFPYPDDDLDTRAMSKAHEVKGVEVIPFPQQRLQERGTGIKRKANCINVGSLDIPSAST